MSSGGKITRLPQRSGVIARAVGDFNPGEQDTIRRAGHDAPARGGEFCGRLSFDKFKQKAGWRTEVIS
ncbi:MAG: SfiI family type II restriction endonuclease [Verrucomicrobiales bacterium]|jgi:hypothetical protein|nr:SfiI family type II restriction endonuclease [Verrucomicrobiales bacterium]